MARDVTFQLDTQGGGVVLQKMSKQLVDETAKRIAQRGDVIAAKSGLNARYQIHGEIGAPNARGGLRYFAGISASGSDAIQWKTVRIGQRSSTGASGTRIRSWRNQAVPRSTHREILSEAARSIKVN